MPAGVSPETARVYMRVARGWNGQSLVEARESGIRLDSIQSVLNALRGESAQSAKNTDDVVKLKRAEIPVRSSPKSWDPLTMTN